uniref:Secreted protein n=1 Tax=Ascaris lumbricoides TaxID=6252 RepID=A0A0M3I0B7_ASCLU
MKLYTALFLAAFLALAHLISAGISPMSLESFRVKRAPHPPPHHHHHYPYYNQYYGGYHRPWYGVARPWGR